MALSEKWFNRSDEPPYMTLFYEDFENLLAQVAVLIGSE
jgi:hypothetical protein